MNRVFFLLGFLLIVLLGSCRSWEVTLSLNENKSGVLSFSYEIDRALLREKGLESALEELPVYNREDFYFIDRYYDGITLRSLSIRGKELRSIVGALAFDNIESLNVLLNDVGLEATHRYRVYHRLVIRSLPPPEEVVVSEASESVELSGSENAAYIFPMMQLLFSTLPTSFFLEVPSPIYTTSRGEKEERIAYITGSLGEVMGTFRDFSWTIQW